MKRLTTEEFIEKAKEIHGDKYDYSKVVYINSWVKVIIICHEHGEFEQTPNDHLSGTGCAKCWYEKIKVIKSISQKEFIQRAIKIHGYKYNYSKVNYTDSLIKITIICTEHGEFEQSPGNHLAGNGCPKCSNVYRYTTEEFIEKAKEIHGDKYDYSKVVYSMSKTKIVIICSEHGQFEQIPSNHLAGRGCAKCRNYETGDRFRLSQEEFIQKAINIHNEKYDYSKVDYIGYHDNVTIICNKHGEFEQSPGNHLAGSGCPICKSSKGELAIKAILDKHGIENKQEWKIPDEDYLFEYDFYLPQLNVLIEFHGIQHYEYVPFLHNNKIENFKEQQERDIFKIELAKLKCIPLIEINYKQFKHMINEQFEEMVINKINNNFLNTTIKDQI